MTEMKDSGFAFIGQIPENWIILRIKHAAWLKGRIGWDGLKAEEFTDKGPYLITGTDFDNGAINWETCVHISDERFEEDQLLHIKEGDLLITKDGTVGKVAIVKGCPEKVSLNSGIMIIRNYTKYKYLDKYMYYTLMSNVFTDWFNYNTKPGTTILHLYQHDFDNFKFLLPPLEEQQQIVTYLDARCSKIDGAVAQRKAIIEKLKEYKSAVITKAVTKGLNPDVEMKDSEIGWIGQIPKTSIVKRIKNIVAITDGTHDTPEYVEPNDLSFPLVTSKCITDGKVVVEEAKHISKADYDEINKRSLVCIYDIIMPMIGTVGNPAFLTKEPKFAIKNVALLRSNGNKTLGKYLWYCLCSSLAKTQFVFYNNGGVQQFITQDKIKNLRFVIHSDINAIVSYLDARCSKIDEAIEKQEQAVAKLEEYRKSVIYYAVTGKIDCRDKESIA